MFALSRMLWGVGLPLPLWERAGERGLCAAWVRCPLSPALSREWRGRNTGGAWRGL